MTVIIMREFIINIFGLKKKKKKLNMNVFFPKYDLVGCYYDMIGEYLVPYNFCINLIPFQKSTFPLHVELHVNLQYS